MSPVLHEIRDQALWITLNRVSRRNAMNGEVLLGIAEGFQAAQRNPAIRAIVLTGAGDSAFCSGGDLQPGASFSVDAAEPRSEFANLLRMVHACPVPSIARVNGACMAGGMGLMCMTDMAVAADHAKFGLPEARIGLFPFQVLCLLKEQLGPRLLREYALTGRDISAKELLAAGLLNRVVPASQLDAAVDSILSSLLTTSPAAIRRGKYALRTLESLSFDEAIAFAEGQIALMTMTEDAKEGLASFNEKRAPRWTGR